MSRLCIAFRRVCRGCRQSAVGFLFTVSNIKEPKTDSRIRINRDTVRCDTESRHRTWLKCYNRSIPHNNSCILNIVPLSIFHHRERRRTAVNTFVVIAFCTPFSVFAVSVVHPFHSDCNGDRPVRLRSQLMERRTVRRWISHFSKRYLPGKSIIKIPIRIVNSPWPGSRSIINPATINT